MLLIRDHLLVVILILLLIVLRLNEFILVAHRTRDVWLDVRSLWPINILIREMWVIHIAVDFIHLVLINGLVQLPLCGFCLFPFLVLREVMVAKHDLKVLFLISHLWLFLRLVRDLRVLDVVIQISLLILSELVLLVLILFIFIVSKLILILDTFFRLFLYLIDSVVEPEDLASSGFYSSEVYYPFRGLILSILQS